MEVNFNLRDSRATSPTPVNIVIRYAGHRIVYPSLEKIHPAQWNGKKQRAKELTRYPEHREFNARLDKMEDRIRTTYRKFLNDHNEFKPSPATFKDLLDTTFRRTERTDAEEVNLLSWKATGNESDPFIYRGYLTKYIEELAVRHNDRTGQPIAKNTIRNYRSFRECLRAFITDTSNRKNRIEFLEVDLDFYYDFMKYLTEVRKLTPNAMGTHIKNLKAVIRSAEERGITANPAYKSRRFVTVQNLPPAIYLTKVEVDQLASLDLHDNERLKRVRDLFLIGCRTGLRFSDFVKLKDEDFENGFIRVVMQKTKETVFIPIHADIKRIRGEYDTENHLPAPISNQKFNDAIKEVCQLISSLRKHISITETKGGVEVTTKVHKWELVSSHTARRTYATNEYLDGVPTQTIREVTGHKEDSDLYRYIRMTNQDHARVRQLYLNAETSALKVV